MTFNHKSKELYNSSKGHQFHHFMKLYTYLARLNMYEITQSDGIGSQIHRQSAPLGATLSIPLAILRIHSYLHYLVSYVNFEAGR